MKKFYIIFPILVSLVFSSKLNAEISIKNPKVVNGKSVCSDGYYLISDACIFEKDLLNYSQEEVILAISIKNDPAAAAKQKEALAYKKENGIPIYRTVVESEKGGNIFILQNGAIVEVSFGFVGFIGYGKKALLYPESGTWKLWIEGKKVFNVSILKNPEGPPTYALTVSDILGMIN